MHQVVVIRRVAGVCAAAAALALPTPALAAATRANRSSSQTVAGSASLTSSCAAPGLTTPFTAYDDDNSYALVPGESPNDFAGAGWNLSGGAKIVSTTLADGTTGDVLDLPSGGVAVSPPMCVTDGYPTARAFIRSVAGSGDVDMNAVYMSSSSSASTIGTIAASTSGWSLSPALNTNPSSVSGWEYAWFTFLGQGSGDESQLYDLYIDPRMKS